MKQRSLENSRQVPLRIAGIYAAAGATWIVLTDLVAARVFHDSLEDFWTNISKGLFFILASALLIYLLVRRALDREAVMRQKMTAGQARLETLKQVIDQSRSVAYVVRAEPGWPLEYISESVARYGYRAGDMLAAQARAHALIHPDDLPGVLAAAEQAVKEGKAEFTVEARFLDADGGIHWGRDYCAVVRDDNGRPTHLRGVIVDITERVRAEAALRDSQRQFAEQHVLLDSLLDSIPDLIFFKDSNSVYLGCNRAFEVYSGMKEAALAGKTDLDIAPREVAELYRSRDREMLASGHAQITEEWIPFKDGGGGWFETLKTPYRDLDGRVFGLIGISRDITRRKQAEERLHLQGAALEAAANAIAITDAGGNVEWVNEAFTRSTGYTREEVIGQNPRVLKSGKHPREFYTAMWKTIMAGEVWRGEMHNRRKDGSPLVEEATITPVKDATGSITHFIAIKQDITDRKALERQFLRAQRMEGIGLLAGGIAHDLNNVLAPILMGAEVLQQETDDQTMQQHLETIAQSARRGADIVKQVLTFARGIEGERVPIQPRHIIKEMIRMARETFPRSFQFQVEVPNDLRQVLGDPTQLHQVLLNLSVNARDAMPGGGRLGYSARNAEVDALFAQANPDARPGPHVVLRVEDSGTGIPAEVLDRIFEPFFTTKEQGKGTGLGLSTVLGIVRSHGGFVTVQSEIGVGTAFEVWLPASQGADAGTASPETEPLPEGDNELVLVVDDETGILQVTRTMLERHGYRVLTAGDGAMALGELSRHLDEVRLVVTDIMMPVMDGVQLIHVLRRMNPELRIIASSGLLGMPGVKDRTEEVLAQGVKHILHKPYSIENLLRAVNDELHPLPPDRGQPPRNSA
jgi:two-component system, cell cycle sensor histidine kinase and response regulator CckA